MVIYLLGHSDISFRVMRLDETESAKQQVIISKLPRYYVNVSSRVPDLPLCRRQSSPKVRVYDHEPSDKCPNECEKKKKVKEKRVTNKRNKIEEICRFWGPPCTSYILQIQFPNPELTKARRHLVC